MPAVCVSGGGVSALTPLAPWEMPSAESLVDTWNRPLSDEEMCQLLSSPMRPSTPSHAPPPYAGVPQRATPPHATPSGGDVGSVGGGQLGGGQLGGGQLGGRLLLSPVPPMDYMLAAGAPPATMHQIAMLRQPTPPHPHSRGPSPAPHRGEQRALAEWAVAIARHPSPQVPPSPLRAGVPPSPLRAAPFSPLRVVRTGSLGPLETAESAAPNLPNLPPNLRRSPRRSPRISPRLPPSAPPCAMLPPPLPPTLPPPLPPSPWSPAHPGGSLLERPATDPRRSPCWSASVGSSWGWSFSSSSAGGGAGALLMLPPIPDRPATDPRRSPARLSSLLDSHAMLRRSPRHAATASPRRALTPSHGGTMLPPPARVGRRTAVEPTADDLTRYPPPP